MKSVLVVGVSLALSAALLSAQDATQPAAPQAAQTTDARWQTERVQQLKQVMERVRSHVKDNALRVEIGTLAPVDLKGSQQTLADLEKAVDADAKRTSRPVKSNTEIQAIRQQVAELIRDLELAEVKYHNGMVRTADMDAAYAAIVKLLIG